MSVRPTPFHIRTAALNRGNDWIARGGFTLPRVFTSVAEEALAARFGAIMTDISWRWRLSLEGARTAEFLARLTTRNAGDLSPGMAHKALWLNDGGGYRGAGVIARYGRESFLLAAAAEDAAWILPAAARFDVKAVDVSDMQGGLALIGPYAADTMTAAGLDPTLEPLAFRKIFWRGLDVTLSRWGEHGGFEIWCAADDAVIVWDRIAKAGETFGLCAAGIAATDVLDMEAGVARPLRDYPPAADGTSADPSPKSLRLEKLIDPEHVHFNGRAAYLTAAPRERLVGIALDSETPAPDMVLYKAGKAVGRMLTSLHSPALRRAVGWARIDVGSSEPGTRLSILAAADATPIAAHVSDLPFLPAPAPIAQ
jgi:aminomethyltransferase